MSIRSITRSVIRFAWPVYVLFVPLSPVVRGMEPGLGARETAIEAALDQETVLDFTDQPLSDVVEFIKQQHQIQIQLDHKALADGGVGSDTTVSARLHDIAL